MNISHNNLIEQHSPWPRVAPWFALFCAIATATLARWPLVTHAEAHLDSDFAVDGLTLIDMLNGHWRWHFPGTPRIGIAPLFLCLPQALIWGANAATLTSGGLVAYGLAVAAIFVLAKRVFGDRVASWGLVPLAFSSTGVVWLSGRLTGGHLPAVAWHAAAFAIFHACLARGGWKRYALFGVWCGFGLHVDAMFMFTCIGLAVAAAWWASRVGLNKGMPIAAATFVAAGAVGLLPAWIGARVDPRDDYPAQFSPTTNPELWVGHTKILALECLPRLISGRMLPDLDAAPDPRMLGTLPPISQPNDAPLFAGTLCAASLALFALGLATLAVDPERRSSPVVDRTARDAVRIGIGIASIGVTGAFIVNLHIYNSDNYRYLVYLLVPWSLGFGLTMEFLSRRGSLSAAVGLAAGLAVLSAVDEYRWLQGFGWIGANRATAARPTIESRLRERLDRMPEVDYIVSDYWLVYRLAFLSGGKIKGRPYSSPNRFPEWGDGGDRDGRRVLILIPSPRGRASPAGFTLREARAAGGVRIDRVGGLEIYSWPSRKKREK